VARDSPGATGQQRMMSEDEAEVRGADEDDDEGRAWCKAGPEAIFGCLCFLEQVLGDTMNPPTPRMFGCRRGICHA
jgi:hypothetical protein